MKTIISKDNPTYKSAMKLLRRKYREESGKYLVEGVKPIRDAIETGIRIEKIFIREGRTDLIPEVDRDEGLTFLSGELFDAMSDTETSQGIIAVAESRRWDMDGFLKETAGGNILLLDRLQDPGNAGTIVRTAEAAGFSGIVTMKGTVDIYSPKVVRAAAGSLFRMPVMSGMDESSLCDFLQSGNLKLIVTSVEGGMDCFEAKIDDPVVLAIGNEGGGISEELLARADMRLMIPMNGHIESLNAAVAAGILMYRIRRHNAGQTQQDS